MTIPKSLLTVFKKTILASICAMSLLTPVAGHADRIRDLVGVQGVRQNQLIGYGLVVGLDGSGDQTTQTPFTVQSLLSMLQQLGINLPQGSSLQLKNVAAVMVTASLPSFAQPGQVLDVTVSSLGNAKSLRGGTLLMTPLKGADGNIYAMAQGNILVAVASAGSGGKGQPAHLSAGRIAAGATVERAVAMNLGNGNLVNLELNESNFSSASKIVAAINKQFGADTAAAQNGRVIRVRVPAGMDERVSFLASLENLNVTAIQVNAKVIFNARTGSVVLNQNVTLEPCAIAHGNLSVVVNTPEGAEAPAEVKKEAGPSVFLVTKSASLSDIVKALNAIGASPQDLLAILQAMKVAGALRAELEII